MIRRNIKQIASSKAVIYFLVFLLTVELLSCNRYYESMKVISEQIRLYPNDLSKWEKLANFTKNSDPWNRYYAYCFLAELMTDKIGNQENLCISLFMSGINDREHHIRHRCVLAINDIGTKAVDSASTTLLEIVKRREEDDITWSAAEALSVISYSNQTLNILKELINVASQPPPQGTDPNAPQLRFFALASGKTIFISHFRDPENAILFEQLLSTSDARFRKVVVEVIEEVKESMKIEN